jgi:hypothetical protein
MKIVHGKKYLVITPDRRYLIVDIYPVGVLTELIRGRRTKQYRASLRNIIRVIKRDVEYRKWHALKSSFNGFLAEPDVMPGKLTRCGSGWTRKRALKDLQRRVNKS